MSLEFFPSGYPDELLYSMHARFTARMRYPSASSAMTMVFGTRQRVAVIDLPSYLTLLCDRLPYPFDADTLIDAHTLFPWYAPFLPSDRRGSIRSMMKGSAGGAIHTRIGAMASRIPSPRYLRYCPHCAVADRATYGETYWHRTHQLSGIMVCYNHHCFLVDSLIQTQRQSIYYQFFAAEDHIPYDDAGEQVHHVLPHAVPLAYSANMLLNSQLCLTLDSLNAGYRIHLKRHSFIAGDDSVRMKALHTEFQNFYGTDFLASLGCVWNTPTSSWLTRLIYKSTSAHHPLYHLLLIHFFGQTAQTMQYIVTVSPPFGTGPWPCLNPICPTDRTSVIKTVSIHYSRYVNDKPIGTFQCPHCQFTYQRTGRDTQPSDELRITKMVQYGTIWESHLKTLWSDMSLSLRAIARSLNADVGTIKRYARILELSDYRPTLRLAQRRQQRIIKKDKTEDYRRLWRELLNQHPDASRQTLRQYAQSAYTYLYRHDRTWLMDHQPPARRSLRQSPQIDWHERDLLIAHAIEEANHHLRTSPDRPKQITLAALGRATGYIMLLQKQLHKLPTTAHMLVTCVETREAWAIRRIQYVMNHASTTEMRLKRWQLIRAAGIDRMKDHPTVLAYLDDLELS